MNETTAVIRQLVADPTATLDEARILASLPGGRSPSRPRAAVDPSYSSPPARGEISGCPPSADTSQSA